MSVHMDAVGLHWMECVQPKQQSSSVGCPAIITSAVWESLGALFSPSFCVMPVMQAEGGLVYPSWSLTARLELRLLSGWKLHVDGSLVYHTNTRYFRIISSQILGTTCAEQTCSVSLELSQAHGCLEVGWRISSGVRISARWIWACLLCGSVKSF